jgi:N-methylhydantoinase B
VIGQMLPDVVFGCLDQAMPGRVPAEGTSCLWTLTMGRSATGRHANARRFMLNAVHNGGTGARPHADGLSATAYPSGVRGTPVEITESISPLLYRRRELRPGSGGAGRTRGGLGQIIEIEALDDAPFGLWAAFDRIQHPPRGRAGGASGEPGRLMLDDGTPLAGKGYQEIPAGRRLIVLTPGGGGYGDPSERDRQAVAIDRRDGLIGIAGGET